MWGEGSAEKQGVDWKKEPEQGFCRGELWQVSLGGSDRDQLGEAR